VLSEQQKRILFGSVEARREKRSLVVFVFEEKEEKEEKPVFNYLSLLAVL